MPTTPLSTLFAERARELGLTAPKIAERTGETYRLVHRLLKGETVPYEFSLKRIAEALGIPEAAWRGAMLASRATRSTEQQAPEFLYAMRFREEHGWVHAPTLTHDGRAVRVRLPDVYVSLSAETELSRADREAQELEGRLCLEKAKDRTPDAPRADDKAASGYGGGSAHGAGLGDGSGFGG